MTSSDDQSMQTKIEWEKLPASTGHGVRATVGDRFAEVIRADEGQWFTFMTIDGRVCKRSPEDPQYESQSEALSRVTRFLRGEITPETWNIKWGGVG